MFRVPKITRNLLSISKMTRDNNVIIELSIEQCVIKDKNNKSILLLGSPKYGLYQLSLARNSVTPLIITNALQPVLGSCNNKSISFSNDFTNTMFVHSLNDIHAKIQLLANMITCVILGMVMLLLLVYTLYLFATKSHCLIYGIARLDIHTLKLPL